MSDVCTLAAGSIANAYILGVCVLSVALAIGCGQVRAALALNNARAHAVESEWEQTSVRLFLCFQAFCAGVKSLDEVNYVIQVCRLHTPSQISRMSARANHFMQPTEAVQVSAGARDRAGRADLTAIGHTVDPEPMTGSLHPHRTSLTSPPPPPSPPARCPTNNSVRTAICWCLID